jgi:antirestriction protein ArdC
MKDIPMKKQEKAPRDHYQDVTQQVIEALEAGTPPWRQPWDSGKAGGPSMPQNAVTGAGYRGINVLTLGVNRAAFMTGDPRWATYKQAQERGWQVMQGSRGVTGYFYKRIEVDGAKSGGESAGEGGKWFPMLRSFTLFHASQIEGIPDYLPPTLEEAPWRAPDAVETIFANSGAEVRIGGPRAFYSTVTDHIQMPPAAAFPSPAAWSSVQVHEGIHWAGSKHRLNRDMSGRFGSKSYAREELVAELGQLNVCSTLGITDCDFVNGAAYLAHWLDILREDKREIFRVAADAQRAADYLLNFHPDYAARLKAAGSPSDSVPADEMETPLKAAA